MILPYYPLFHRIVRSLVPWDVPVCSMQDDSQPPLPDPLLDQCMVEYAQYLCGVLSATIIAVVKAPTSEAAGMTTGHAGVVCSFVYCGVFETHGR